MDDEELMKAVAAMDQEVDTAMQYLTSSLKVLAEEEPSISTASVMTALAIVGQAAAEASKLTKEEWLQLQTELFRVMND